jgi:hypothetical protein
MSKQSLLNPVFITVVSLIVAAASSFTMVKAMTENDNKRIDKLETKCDSIEGMKTDINWIKKTVDKIDRKLG